MSKNSSVILFLVLLLSSCNVLEETADQELDDGVYLKKSGKEKQQVYVNVANDSVRIHPTTSAEDLVAIDTLQAANIYLSELENGGREDLKLYTSGIDVDFLTIPAKLRFAGNDVPAQINSELNGAIYVGYKKNKYIIKYRMSPLHVQERKIIKLGYSLGLFTGFGSTFISPTTTNFNLEQEYDGIVWSKGLAGIIEVNRLSVGIAVGFDNLIDKNKNIWIYENKPWIGLGVGLNLN